MFPQLPEEIEYKIWKIYHNMYVLKEIKESPSIWRDWKDTPPSKKLFENSSDYGAIQINHSDFERLFYTWVEDFHSRIFKIVLGKKNYECCGSCYIGKYSKRCEQITYESDFEDQAEKYWDLSYYWENWTLEEINSDEYNIWGDYEDSLVYIYSGKNGIEN